MPSSFNEKNLAGVAGLVNVGTFMRIVGENGLGVPFEGCGSESVVETASVAVSPPGDSSDPGEEVSELTAASISPPGDSSDPGEEVSELTAVTREVVMSPPMLEGGLTLAVLPSWSLEQLAKMQGGDPALPEQSAVEECLAKTADPLVGLDILPVVGPSLSEAMEPAESEIMSPGAGKDPVVVFRRSNRINKGQHSNPAHLPKFG